MCGIAGYISAKEQDPKAIERMLASQQHRGPDNSDYVRIRDFDHQVCIGHNRLCIIDLSERANQPMVDEETGLVIVLNGEIFNYLELKEELSAFYHFQTESDTEVLLKAFHRWGEKALDKCIGMFAFVIFDTKKGSFFAARDRFGVKPFYYYQDETLFAFASEIKALFASGFVPKQPNVKEWAAYFMYGSYGGQDTTFWECIRQLPGGHSMRFVEGTLSIQRYYDFAQQVAHFSDSDGIDHAFLSLATNAVALRFRSDVELGVAVSGGLDSSLLLALVNRIFPKTSIKAYTFFCNDVRYDELPWVEQMIAATSLDWHKVLVTPDVIIQDISFLSDIEDEPFGGFPTIAMYEVFKAGRQRGTVVFIDGQGMDESWAGYDYYATNSNNIIQSTSKNPLRPACLTDTFRQEAVKHSAPCLFDDPLQNKQYRDIFHTKIPRALRFNDRVSMANGVELRSPFLDHRLVELGFAAPSALKIHEGIGKYVPRLAVAQLLPDGVRLAPKRPLQTPQREWMGGVLCGFVEQRIEAFLAAQKDWFNPDAVMKEWHGYLAGDNESSFHIWQWINSSYLLTR